MRNPVTRPDLFPACMNPGCSHNYPRSVNITHRSPSCVQESAPPRWIPQRLTCRFRQWMHRLWTPPQSMPACLAHRTSHSTPTNPRRRAACSSACSAARRTRKTQVRQASASGSRTDTELTNIQDYLFSGSHFEKSNWPAPLSCVYRSTVIAAAVPRCVSSTPPQLPTILPSLYNTLRSYGTVFVLAGSSLHILASTSSDARATCAV